MYATQKSPDRGLALQKYLLLHSQHGALSKHLSQISTRVETSRSPSRHSSISSSPGSGSEDNVFEASSPPRVGRNHRRSGSIQLSRRPPMTTRRSSAPTLIDEIQEDEMKLKEVNLQIKGALTDLLNCDNVRQDVRYRNWVQTRLMDAEMELKMCRARSCDRRRSEEGSGMLL